MRMVLRSILLIAFQALVVLPLHAQNMLGHFPELITVPGEQALGEKASGEQAPSTLFTMQVNGAMVRSDDFEAEPGGAFIHRGLQLQAVVSEVPVQPGIHCRRIRFMNRSGDTLEVENLLPLGASPRRPYITSYGPPGLTRATLFRPGSGPVGLIVPDNAWEMGATFLEQPPDSVITLLARRDTWKGSARRRYSTLLYPGGELSYLIYSEKCRGDWKEGLARIFRDRWLYDMPAFDRALYDRRDLQWIRDDYLAVLQFAWDQDFYSVSQGSYAPFREFFHRFDPLLGGYDIYGLWQGWPRLGLDQRNQWDLLRDLPGGLDSLLSLARYCQDQDCAFFLSYNPWDESTRKEDPMEALSGLIREIHADGVVLDTRGRSDTALRAAADRAKPGVVMYSEGMAVARDMPGILSGRVHNAIRLSPPLNLNRLIQPEFQVFRVLDLRDGRPHREMAVSLFNGYGVELNLFSPAHPWWTEEEYTFMGRCLRILRENQKAFHDPGWHPLVESPDSLWVNQWKDGEKVLFTLLSLNPKGYYGSLLPGQFGDLHWVSLWDHEEIDLSAIRVDPFTPAFAGTRREGSVQVVAGFPALLAWSAGDDSLVLEAPAGNRVVVWKGDPSYGNPHHAEFSLQESRTISLPLADWMHGPEGKIVVQLFDGKELRDERIIRTALASPVQMRGPGHTRPYRRTPEGMVRVQGGAYRFYRGSEADFIPYPHNYDTLILHMEDFYMDRYPVTNREFAAFLRSASYQPADSTHFLRHWEEGHFPDSLADHPVVWISLDDARAYAKWKGKRLPTEAEWQYAAQGPDGRKWPWGMTYDSTRCNHAAGHTLPVTAFPEGQSPFGVEDLVGNVWQMCGEEYTNGTYAFSMIRGGSFYRPTSSWWYVQGGPRSNQETQMLLLTAPGFDRSATVGFRCVCDP